MRRSEITEVHAVKHEVMQDGCGADSQGAISYALQQNLHNEFKRRGIENSQPLSLPERGLIRRILHLIKPTKSIGGFISEEEAQVWVEDGGWLEVKNTGRGWGRGVAS